MFPFLMFYQVNSFQYELATLQVYFINQNFSCQFHREGLAFPSILLLNYMNIKRVRKRLKKIEILEIKLRKSRHLLDRLVSSDIFLLRYAFILKRRDTIWIHRNLEIRYR